MALSPPSLIFYLEKSHGRQGVGGQNEKLRKKCPANAWQALFRQKKLRIAEQVSNSLPSVGSTKPRRGFGGLCGPYGASRARLAPPCGRCWAIRGTAPVKLAQHPERPRSGICAGLFGLHKPFPGKDR